MATSSPPQTLQAVLLPDGLLQLEPDAANKKQTRSSTLLQQEIYSVYKEDRSNWLLFLGFSDAEVILPDSLNFWRRLSSLFVHELRLTPDLEELRHQINIPLPESEIASLLETMPPMIGGEHLNTSLLSTFWSALNTSFTTSIEQFSGSVAEFIHHYSPNSHLLGRIYFHLVENKDDDVPFAFLATYSTRMGGDGQSKHLPLKSRLMLGEDELSMEEVKRLLDEVEGLAFIKNKWVAVDQKKLQETLSAYEQAQKLASQEGLTLAEAIRLQLHSNAALLTTANADVLEIENGEWLQSVFSRMTNPGKMQQVNTDDRFKAHLRPYQQDGLRWLCELNRLGFGACLADDMGMGKTVQLLAFLNILTDNSKRKNKPAASLLIIPASLLANWEQEIEKFFPRLRVFYAHPSMHTIAGYHQGSGQALLRL